MVSDADDVGVVESQSGRVTGNPHTGTYSFRAAYTNSAGGIGPQFSQTVTVIPGATYILSYYVYLDTNSECNVDAYMGDTQIDTGFVDFNNIYTQQSASITVDATTTSLSFTFYLGCNTNSPNRGVYVDDITLTLQI